MDWSNGLAERAIESGAQLCAAIYSRVSKDPTGRQRSVEEQDDANQRAATTNGWQVSEDTVYIDNDRSASRFATKTRPQWERLRSDVAAGKYHVVVLWEVSRGDRDALGWLEFLAMCRNLGVLIHITSHRHTYDTRKRRDYKTLAEEGLDSADESEKISERIRRDVEANAQKGMPHGVVTYGYRREYEVDASGRRRIVAQVPDEEPRTVAAVDGSPVIYTPAGIVREVTRRLLAGEAIRAVTADLNSRGVPSPRSGPRGWSPFTVRRIAANPVYAGIRVHRGLPVVAAVWPALVDPADHHALVARFSDPARRTSRDTTIRHLGSGLYVCGVCGNPVRTVTQYYGRAYTCWPPRLVSRSSRVDRRKVSDEETAALRRLAGSAQTARVLELYESGVSQISMSRALGVTQSALSMRLAAERKRRGAAAAPPAPRGERAHHVSRNVDEVDAYVQMAVWQRLAREDVAALLAEDARADERMAVLAAEITEKQVRLDAARDGYARDGRPTLETLNRIEATLAPEIERARERMHQSRVGPVLSGLMLPSPAEVEAEWWRRSIPQRREVIRVLIERVEILRLRNKKTYRVVESVRIVWRRPRR